MKIWFLTRSIYPYQKTGGGQIRYAQVEHLKKLGWNIEVVMPDYAKREVYKTEGMTKIPFRQNHRFVTLLEIIGLYEDYLDKWVKEAFVYLKEKVQKEDIIFATSGGELGMIKLGSLLKKELGCKFIVNFHDPLVYSLVHGKKYNYRFHVSREKVERKYIKDIDFIVTSSQSYKDSLIDKYPFLEQKIKNIYFGYIEELSLGEKVKKQDDYINIAYVGTMSSVQKPEILLKLLDKFSQIKIFFIGNHKEYLPLMDIKHERVILVDYLSHDQFLEFMYTKIDIGFVSLADDYFSACVPSKIYEYINLGIPMLGALPEGDGMDIIKNNKFGVSCLYKDIECLEIGLEKLLKPDFLLECKENLLSQKVHWAMSSKILVLDKLLKEITK